MITQSLSSLLVQGSFRFATCFAIYRTDAISLFFTDFNKELVIDGETYRPASGGVIGGAQQHNEGLSTTNTESRGVIDDDGITNEDLYAGKYRQARVEIFVVDSRYPWAGKFNRSVYYVQETTFDGEVWSAQLAGLAIRLQPRIGGNFQLRCRWKQFGGSDCGFNRSSVTSSGKSVSAVSKARRVFTSNVSGADALYDRAVIVWTSGANNGVLSTVKKFLSSGGTIELQIATPFTITAGDQFSISKDCDRTEETCKGFGNYANFGGFPDLPGTDKMLSTPNA